MPGGLNKDMLSPEQILDIGIRRLNMTSEMARLINIAETKKEIRFILETMIKELDEGIAEIDMLCQQTGE